MQLSAMQPSWSTVICANDVVVSPYRARMMHVCVDKPLVVLQALNRAKVIDEYHLQLTKFSDLGTSSVRSLVLYLKAMVVEGYGGSPKSCLLAGVSEIEDLVRTHNQRGRGTTTARLG